jgi:hypothetical protein
MTRSLPATSAPGDLGTLLADWSRHERPRNLSPRTIASYTATGEEFWGGPGLGRSRTFG